MISRTHSRQPIPAGIRRYISKYISSFRRTFVRSESNVNENPLLQLPYRCLAADTTKSQYRCNQSIGQSMQSCTNLNDDNTRTQHAGTGRFVWLSVMFLCILSSSMNGSSCEATSAAPMQQNDDIANWGQPGYLTVEQEDALHQFKAAADARMIERGKFTTEPVDSACLRFLRARRFNVQEALALLIESDRNYHAEGVVHFSQLSAEECTQCDLKALMKWYPHAELGYDKLGRPILFEATGLTDTSMVLQLTSLQNLFKYHCWYMERIVNDLFVQRPAAIARYGVNHDDNNSGSSSRSGSSGGDGDGDGDVDNRRFSTCVILDMSGLSISHVAGSMMSHTQSLIAFDSACYPEVLGQMFVVNTPWWAVTTWEVISCWLDPRTQAKIEILGSGPEVTKKLLQYIDADVLPRAYGGNAPDPLPVLEAASDAQFAYISSGRSVAKNIRVPAGGRLCVDSYVTTGEFELEVYYLEATSTATTDSTDSTARLGRRNTGKSTTSATRVKDMTLLSRSTLSQQVANAPNSGDNNGAPIPTRIKLFFDASAATTTGTTAGTCDGKNPSSQTLGQSLSLASSTITAAGDTDSSKSRDVDFTVVWRNKDSYYTQPLAYNAFIDNNNNNSSSSTAYATPPTGAAAT